MIAFQYKHGDRPLEGYRIERAAGRGGFGEVYYAISDSGREVALKAILGYEQIELRGISQCMNLKSPHLVTIFDVKYNDQGRPFVIMEFVNGPSLRQLLDESPAGLGEQKAAFFLREIAKGLTFLHESGIVHRDLKPANIFYENGYVKICDYGLSKAISTNHHSGQTVTVGTVHYMAPEIGVGKYDRSIDIYALGACLYEMLTGTPPFIGASPSEVLMKHLSTEPDCSGISEPFRTVICKAMAKDPTQRYQSVQEMVEAVFGAEHIRQSVSVFSPMDLSMVAQHAAKAVPRGVGAAEAGAARPPRPRVNEMIDSDALRWVPPLLDRALGPAEAEAADPLSRGQRAALGLITMIVIAVAGGLLASGGRLDLHEAVFFVWLAVAGAATGTLVLCHYLTPKIDTESRLVQGLASGGAAVVLAFLVSALVWGPNDLGNNLPQTWLAIAAPLFFMNTRRWSRSRRPLRVNFWEDVFLAGLFAWIAGMVLNGNGILAAAVAGGTALVTQVAAPWDRRRAMAAQEQKAAASARAASLVNGNGNAAHAVPPPLPRQVIASQSALNKWGEVSRGVRWMWVVFMILSFTAAMMFFVAAGMTHSNSEQGAFLATGLSFLAGTLIFLIQACRRRYYGKWSYLFKPLSLLACMVSILVSSVMLGFERMSTDETTVAAFFIVFPACAGITLLFIPGTRRPAPQLSPLPTPAPPGPDRAGLDVDPVEARQAGKSAPPDPGPLVPAWRDDARWGAHSSGAYSVVSSLPGLARKGVSGVVILTVFTLMLASILAGLIVALDLPHMLAAGTIDPQLAEEMNQQVFANYPQWPQLISRILIAAAFVLMAAAVIVLVIARRSGGVLHMLRAVVGAAGLLFALLPLSKSFGGARVWREMADAIHLQQNPPLAIDLFLSGWHPGVVLALLVFLASLVVLFWTPRKPQAAKSAPLPMLKEVAV